MVFNEVVLFNYGPFQGENRVKLAPEQGNGGSSRNIILIGGKNGCGKTSIFTAIQLCLYGHGFVGRTSRKFYDDFLKDLIHRPPVGVPADMASVELDFDFSVAGERDNYRIKRVWQVNSKGQVSEAINIHKNGNSLDSLAEKNWQEFMNYLIPPGLLRLFFFDGERINSLTKDDHNQEFAESVESLFGISVVKQLRADLRYFERKVLVGVKFEEREARIREIESQLKKHESESVIIFEEIAQLQTEIDQKKNGIESIQNELSRKGFFGGESRESVLSKVKEMQIEIDDRNRMLRQLFQRALPFSYAALYLRKTIDALKCEQESRLNLAYQKRFDVIWGSTKSEVVTFLKDKNQLDSLYKRLVGNTGTVDIDLRHNHATDSDAQEIIRCFSDEVLMERKEARRIAEEIERLLKEQATLRGQLEIGNNDQTEVADTLKQLEGLSKECGGLEGQLAKKEVERDNINADVLLLQKEYEKLLGEIGELAAHNRKLSWVERSISALHDFESKLLNHRISLLEKNIHLMLSNLLRKADMIHDVKIDTNNFEVYLEDSSGHRLNKKKLSEGEQQVFAMSLLSGITKTSGRLFPVIIDTPLGRLDKDHRTNIIHKYFPKASHQLIILSTDTEIDQNRFAEIKPYLSASYLFDYNEDQGRTTIRNGYFWE